MSPIASLGLFALLEYLDSDKVRAISEFQRPKTVKQLRRFLGVYGFIKNKLHNSVAELLDRG